MQFMLIMEKTTGPFDFFFLRQKKRTQNCCANNISLKIQLHKKELISLKQV